MTFSTTKRNATRCFLLGPLALGLLGSSLSPAQVILPDGPTDSASQTNAVSDADPAAPADPAAASAAATPAALAALTAPSALGAPAAPIPPSLKEAAALYAENKADEALGVVNAVLETAHGSINAYILRGAIYSEKKDWSNAEKDYQTALQLDTRNDGVRYDLADLKFKQKQFDAAREAFVAIQKNPDADIEDLIQYKIFVCDLMGGHDAAASKELDAFNQAGADPSYYFGNAAWDLVHKNPEEARTWLILASHIYPERKQLLYAGILKDTGYLPLPPMPDAK